MWIQRKAMLVLHFLLMWPFGAAYPLVPLVVLPFLQRNGHQCLSKLVKTPMSMKKKKKLQILGISSSIIVAAAAASSRRLVFKKMCHAIDWSAPLCSRRKLHCTIAIEWWMVRQLSYVFIWATCSFCYDAPTLSSMLHDGHKNCAVL